MPVTIRPPHPQNLQTTLPTVRMIVDVSKSVLVLSNQNVIKLLKSKVCYPLEIWLENKLKEEMDLCYYIAHLVILQIFAILTKS